MTAKLVIAALLASSSAPAFGQDAARTASAGAAAVWPHMHQCTIRPASTDDWTRIDLHLANPASGDGGPTITAHAINTKGTGAAGRLMARLAIKTKGTNAQRAAAPLAIECATSAVTGDNAAQKASLASLAYMRTDGNGPGWSCSVSGTKAAPTFHIGLLVPAASARSAATPTGYAVSIVSHGVEHSDSWHVACKAKEPKNTGYDLAVIKKP